MEAKEMEQVIVEAECVDIHCYRGSQSQLYQTIESLPFTSPLGPKQIKAVFYINDLKMK